MLRHGESAKNAGLNVSPEENVLTLRGVKQLVEVNKKLRSEKIDAIFCSPSERCKQTLEEILEGRTDDMAIHLSQLLKPRTNKESLEQLKRRVELLVDDLKYDFTDEQVVLIISHQAVIKMINFVITKEGIDLPTGGLVEVIL